MSEEITLDDLLEMSKTQPESDCKGRVYRGYENNFVSNGNIGLHCGLRLLKRKSCPGCPDCGWMDSDIHEFVLDSGLILPKKGIEHGKLYTLRVVNVSTDWETGYADGYDLEVVEYKEEE